MVKRNEYSLDLSGFDPYSPPPRVANISIRPAERSAASTLAELMIAAYRGTIDYDGETLEDAIAEVRAYLAGERGGRPLLEVSRLAFAGPLLAGACLAGEWDERQLPLIAYVMTRADWKQRGLGRQLLWEVLQSLHSKGYGEVRAVITEGNTPSERLFTRIGFQKIGQ